MPAHHTTRASLSIALLTALAAMSILAGCAGDSSTDTSASGEPSSTPAANAARALEIADEVLAASGGAEAWQATRYVTWVNFGRRLEVWDKQTGDIRVENDATIILMNLDSGEGRAWRFGQEITDPADLERTLDYAREAFLLDSHEILLPFLLHDEGVHLDYLGEGTVEAGNLEAGEGEGPERPVDILKVTFDEGAPYSRAEYHLSVDKESRHIVRWDYYMDRGDATPRFRQPWSNYEKYGKIRLSDQRGPKQHMDVNVFDELPASVFASPEPVPWLRAEGDPAP